MSGKLPTFEYFSSLKHLCDSCRKVPCTDEFDVDINLSRDSALAMTFTWLTSFVISSVSAKVIIIISYGVNVDSNTDQAQISYIYYAHKTQWHTHPLSALVWTSYRKKGFVN